MFSLFHRGTARGVNINMVGNEVQEIGMRTRQCVICDTCR